MSYPSKWNVAKTS